MTVPASQPPNTDTLIETFEKALAHLATGGTIVCRDCNASDVTDDDHRPGCAVWGVRHAFSAVVAGLQRHTEEAERERDEAKNRLSVVLQEVGEIHGPETDRQLIRELRWANQSLVARIHELEGK